MSDRDQIKELALAVNDALSHYISVHDAIFQESATLKSFLKNLVGRGVPLSRLVKESERLVPLWDDLHARVAQFHRSRYPFLSVEERRYFDILSRYVDAVRATVTALVERQRLLSQRSIGGERNPVSLEAFQRKHQAYEELIRRYTQIGHELGGSNPLLDQQKS